MNVIKNYLTTHSPPAGTPPYLSVEPSTRYGWVIGPDGEPHRIDSNFNRVVVPTYDLSAARIDEDELIAKVLATAACQAPLKVAQPAQVDKTFWIKTNRHMKLFLFHPELRGKFFLPVGVPTYLSEVLPRNQITCLGPAAFAGYYVRQNHRRGVLAHDKKGLLGIQFSVLEP